METNIIIQRVVGPTTIPYHNVYYRGDNRCCYVVEGNVWRYSPTGRKIRLSTLRLPYTIPDQMIGHANGTEESVKLALRESFRGKFFARGNQYSFKLIVVNIR
ncbi:hypothetical protein HZB88_04095 [archaeon]|nr:hypothetical protein [archaeon]